MRHTQAKICLQKTPLYYSADILIKIVLNDNFLYLAYQDQCTQFENVLGSIAESQYHGTCVHKDQCPLGLFTAINFCLDTNNQNYDIVCCLTANPTCIL